MHYKVHDIINNYKLKKYFKAKERVNSYKDKHALFADEQLQGRFRQLSLALREGEGERKYLLEELVSVIREGAKRKLGLFLYDVQVVAGLVLAEGKIAEIGTGEGKTLIAIIPAILHAIRKKGVHVSTVNMYLAERDYEFTRPLFDFLGISSALITNEQTPEEKIKVYYADITYGTGYQFGFDFLRHELLVKSAKSEDEVPPTFKFGGFALIDEVDSVLIDEANMPLIISNDPNELSKTPGNYLLADQMAARLIAGKDYNIYDYKNQVQLTDCGLKSTYNNGLIEHFRDIKRPIHLYIESALQARYFFKKDIQYLVEDEKVVIIDQETGRKFPDRTWRAGLHQAIQAKEKLPITQESDSLVSVTRQKFFQLYPKFSGMTGTAFDNRNEFYEFFKLDTIRVPFNKPCVQEIERPRVFSSDDQMLSELMSSVRSLHELKRPILIGTNNLKTSEMISRELEQSGLKYQLLDAKNDEDEAEKIKNAGEWKAITIATNMAGRGTHISVPEDIAEGGGLAVLAINLNEAKRIDRQLFGRSARQGQRGSAQLFLSLEDPLLEKYSPNKAKRRSKSYSAGEGGIRIFNSTQKKIEKLNYLRRKKLIAEDKWLESFSVTP